MLRAQCAEGHGVAQALHVSRNGVSGLDRRVTSRGLSPFQSAESVTDTTVRHNRPLGKGTGSISGWCLSPFFAF